MISSPAVNSGGITTSRRSPAVGLFSLALSPPSLLVLPLDILSIVAYLPLELLGSVFEDGQSRLAARYSRYARA